jgi:hypothetical protein
VPLIEIGGGLQFVGAYSFDEYVEDLMSNPQKQDGLLCHEAAPNEVTYGSLLVFDYRAHTARAADVE